MTTTKEKWTMQDCKECKGFGYIVVGHGKHREHVKCTRCGGTGNIKVLERIQNENLYA